MAKMTKEIMNVFNNPRAIKVLATESEDKKLNNVPIMSFCAPDEETLAFGDMFLDKTKKNLLKTKKAAVVAFILSDKPGVIPSGFQVKGTFQEFQTSGPIYDRINQMTQQVLGKGIKAAGIIKVEEGYNITPMSAYRVF